MMVARHDSRSERPDPAWPEPQGTPVHPPMSISMTAHDVLRVLDVLHLSGVTALVTGGWGVDALIGRQTRTHRDLDLLVNADDRTTALETLVGIGYSTVELPGDHLATFRQRDGRSIDVEFIGRDDSDQLPTAALDGRGFIVGRPVRCVSANGQVLLHADVDLPQDQRRDLWLLADRCGATLAAPLGRTPHVSYRRADPTDLGAMAVLRHRALQHAFASPTSSLLQSVATASPALAWRYWTGRFTRPTTWIGVMVIGGAVGATAAVAAPMPTERFATLFALHLDPSLPDRHLLDPLLQRALFAAHEFGTDDVRVWLYHGNVADVRFFEQRGWRPDGAHHAVAGAPLVRYARR
jgi:lincosamide nucleotidyltransferase A/C/D/E